MCWSRLTCAVRQRVTLRKIETPEEVEFAEAEKAREQAQHQPDLFENYDIHVRGCKHQVCSSMKVGHFSAMFPRRTRRSGWNSDSTFPCGKWAESLAGICGHGACFCTFSDRDSITALAFGDRREDMAGFSCPRVRLSRVAGTRSYFT